MKMVIKAAAKIARNILRDALGVVIVNIARDCADRRDRDRREGGRACQGQKSRSQVRNSGSLCFPTTLSRMILSGQGAAMLMAVSNSMAMKTTTSHLR